MFGLCYSNETRRYFKMSIGKRGNSAGWVHSKTRWFSRGKSKGWCSSSIVTAISELRATTRVITLHKISKYVDGSCYGYQFYNKNAVQLFSGSAQFARQKPILSFNSVRLGFFGPIKVLSMIFTSENGKKTYKILNT